MRIVCRDGLNSKGILGNPRMGLGQVARLVRDMKTANEMVAILVLGLSPVLFCGCATDRSGPPLPMVAEKGDATKTKRLLDEGANPNMRDRQSGWTALHHAAYGGQPEVARLLLDAGAKTELKDNQGFTPLHWAVYESMLLPGSVETAKLLIARGANVNSRDKEGSTPLFWAVFQGNKELVMLLLQKGADVKLTGKEGLTPAQSARKYEKPELATLIEGASAGRTRL